MLERIDPTSEIKEKGGGVGHWKLESSELALYADTLCWRTDIWGTQAAEIWGLFWTAGHIQGKENTSYSKTITQCCEDISYCWRLMYTHMHTHT